AEEEHPHLGRGHGATPQGQPDLRAVSSGLVLPLGSGRPRDERECSDRARAASEATGGRAGEERDPLAGEEHGPGRDLAASEPVLAAVRDLVRLAEPGGGIPRAETGTSLPNEERLQIALQC